MDSSFAAYETELPNNNNTNNSSTLQNITTNCTNSNSSCSSSTEAEPQYVEHQTTHDSLLAILESAGDISQLQQAADEQQPQHEQHQQAKIYISLPSSSKGSKQLNAEKKISSTSQEDKDNEKTTISGKRMTELLGSVTTHTCPGTRTSARVIQKMKLDSTRPTTPPIPTNEIKSTEKTMQKTPSQVRHHKSAWSNLERNYFFDALNEFGKDFESLGNYINAKLKRKSATDISYKTKEQVRQHYYQTFHKICKYIRFSEEIKKMAQELYALINYGEMRRKLQFVTDKHFMKLKQLVYQGHITVRCKGKNLRIKTPSCKALRKLNQLDDSLEDIRLPSKIEVIVCPANMESFGRVQSIAQNPRVRTTVPLHMKLHTFIKTFEYKWRSNEVKLHEEAVKLALSEYGEAQQPTAATTTPTDSQMCFQPKPGVPIHRPLLSITEYLSSLNLCLTAYEERMGVKVRSETLSFERFGTKRQRTESGSEKRSPDTKKHKQMLTPTYETNFMLSDMQLLKDEMPMTMETTAQELELLLQQQKAAESSGDELSDEPSDQTQLNEEETQAVGSSSVHSQDCENAGNMSSRELDALEQAESAATQMAAQQARSKRAANMRAVRNSLTFRPLVSDEIIRHIRKGWTSSSAADITIGDLYVVLGQDSKLELDYYWLETPNTSPLKSSDFSNTHSNSSSSQPSNNNNMEVSQLRLPYAPSACEDAELVRKVSAAEIGSKLKHLLIVANLSERIRKRQCSCGHICERNAGKGRLVGVAGGAGDFIGKTYLASKQTQQNTPAVESNSGGFRQPQVPARRQMYSAVVNPVKQLSTLTRQKMSRQVLVQRMLLPGGGNPTVDMPDSRSLQEERQQMALFYGDTMPSSASSSKSTDSTDGSDYKSTINKDTPCSTSNLDDELEKVYNEVSSSRDNGTVSDEVEHSDATASEQTPADEASTTTPSSSLCMPASVYDENTNTSQIFNGMFSPMHLFRDSSSNSRWLEENLNDFSLTSLLGHLDEMNATRDPLDPSSNISVISESSVDFRHKFQEITALLQSQEKE